MRAVAFISFGKPEKLEVLDLPDPTIFKPDDILVQVDAAGLNPVDMARLAGYTRLAEKVKLPAILGIEYCGTVTQVGPSVTEFSPGDRVFGGTPAGCTAADYLLLSPSVPPFSIAKVPEALSAVEAASLPAVGHTMLTALSRADAEVPGGLKDKTVFVPAGLSGTGSFALQILKSVYGAGKVITTVSTKKVPLINSLIGEGKVDQIVDYTTQNVIKEIGKGTVDVMFDTSLLAMSSLPLMRPGVGYIYSITGKSGESLKKDLPDAPWLLLKLMDCVDWIFVKRAARWGVTYSHVYVRMEMHHIQLLTRLVEEGKLKTVVGERVHIDDLTAIRRVCGIISSGKGGIGKYVIQVR